LFIFKYKLLNYSHTNPVTFNYFVCYIKSYNLQFDGSAGEVFQKAAATFCARQQIALESLKEKRKKDTKLNIFLNEAEGNPVCKRLQLKDILPTGMIR